MLNVLVSKKIVWMCNNACFILLQNRYLYSMEPHPEAFHVRHTRANQIQKKWSQCWLKFSKHWLSIQSAIHLFIHKWLALTITRTYSRSSINHNKPWGSSWNKLTVPLSDIYVCVSTFVNSFLSNGPTWHSRVPKAFFLHFHNYTFQHIHIRIIQSCHSNMCTFVKRWQLLKKSWVVSVNAGWCKNSRWWEGLDGPDGAFFSDTANDESPSSI